MSKIQQIKEFLTLESRVLVLFSVIFLITSGEQLWMEYIPVYFIKLGGTVITLGIFQSVSNTLEAINQMPGGIISDKLGRIRASVFFIIFGLGGYIIYAISPSWQFLFIGLFFIQGTSSLLQPTVFAIIGDNLPTEKRTSAFTVQSILKRIPIIFVPTIGGFIIGGMGVVSGVKFGLSITIILGILGLLLIRYTSSNIKDEKAKKHESEVLSRSIDLPRKLRPLLMADILARFGQATIKIFLILHVLTIVEYHEFGILIGIQMTVSIISYAPAAYFVRRVGHKPVIIVSFICFALYPILIIFANSYFMLAVGYVVAGGKEFGEPARKSLIVDLTSISERGKNVGFYYSLRSVAIIPASILGAHLWEISSEITAITASSIAALGLLILLFFVSND